MNRVPLIILDLFVVKVSIPLIIWIVLIDLKRLNCHFKMHFFSKLSASPCSDSEYHATEVWDAFRCKTMADYHYLFAVGCVACGRFFLKSSIELVWNSIALIHYITILLLVLHGMLLLECHLITDNDMYNFVENSIRGRVSDLYSPCTSQ